MNKLNNKGQALVMFVCLLPILIAVVGVVIDVSSMTISKNKLNNINKIAVSLFKDVNNSSEDIINIIKINDENIKNIMINKEKKTVIIDKEINSIFGGIIGIKKYKIVSKYQFVDGKIKRIK